MIDKELITSAVSTLVGSSILCAAFGVFPYVLTMGSFWGTCGAIAGGLYVALKIINKSDV